VSPCTLTRLDLSAAHVDSYIRDAPALLRQLHHLRHCKLGYCDGAWRLRAAGSSAAQLAAVRGLSSLTYLCMERDGLTAKDLARHLYCRADVLPQLRVLEINVVTWSKPCFRACVWMGSGWPNPQCNVKFEAEVGAVQWYYLLAACQPVYGCTTVGRQRLWYVLDRNHMRYMSLMYAEVCRAVASGA
jgi:hypothetical protein